MIRNLLVCAVVSLGWIAPAGAAVIKVATIAPEGSQWMKEMRAGAKEIKQRTGGRVQIKLYGGGVQGPDKKVLRKIRIGQLHGGAFASTGLASRYSGLNLYGIPLIFRSFDEVDYVRARMDERIRAGLYKAGFVSFGFAEGGFAYLMSNTPIRTVDDLTGRKTWVPENDEVSFLAMEALGLSPVVLPITDVLTGLQTSLLDVIATSPVGALVLQWHTKVKYITDLPVSYIIGFLAIDRKVFDRLAADDQKIVREVLEQTYRRLDETARTDDRAALAALRKAGLEFVTVADGDVRGWRQELAGLNTRLRQDGTVEPALLEQMLDLLAEYRANPVAAGAGAAPTAGKNAE